MRTHVDTAAAVRIVDTDLFASAYQGGIVQWREMGINTVFLEEDDDVGLLELCRLAAPRRAEIVRVSRVIDIVDTYRRQNFTVAVA